MRIGIVTFHCAYNFGSVLQAWALRRQLSRMGHEVRVVDYRGRDFDQYRLVQAYSPKALAASVALYPRQRRRRDAFEAFIDRELAPTARYGVDDEARMRDELPGRFDCFVCGSDQIWNLDCTRVPVGPYFLSFAGDARRVAYAPSLSHLSFSEDHFGPVQRRQVAEWLAPFHAVSVREEATARLFADLCPVPIETCLDPTLLLDAADYAPVAAPGEAVSDVVGGDVADALFVYMLERNDAMVSAAARLAREAGVTIAYVSRRPLRFEGVRARNLFGIGPAEFLGVLRDCGAVLTNSFHATVFSLLLGVPFRTFATSRSGSRMRELLAGLGAADRLVAEEELAAGLGMPTAPDVAAPGDRLGELRGRSLAFLDRALAE